MAKELSKKAILGILAISDYFVRGTARLDTVFNLNFNILHAKVANNSLGILDHTVIVESSSASGCIRWKVQSNLFWVVTCYSTGDVASFVYCPSSKIPPNQGT